MNVERTLLAVRYHGSHPAVMGSKLPTTHRQDYGGDNKTGEICADHRELAAA